MSNWDCFLLAFCLHAMVAIPILWLRVEVPDKQVAQEKEETSNLTTP